MWSLSQGLRWGLTYTGLSKLLHEPCLFWCLKLVSPCFLWPVVLQRRECFPCCDRTRRHEGRSWKWDHGSDSLKGNQAENSCSCWAFTKPGLGGSQLFKIFRIISSFWTIQSMRCPHMWGFISTSSRKMSGSSLNSHLWSHSFDQEINLISWWGNLPLVLIGNCSVLVELLHLFCEPKSSSKPDTALLSSRRGLVALTDGGRTCAFSWKAKENYLLSLSAMPLPFPVNYCQLWKARSLLPATHCAFAVGRGGMKEGGILIEKIGLGLQGHNKVSGSVWTAIYFVSSSYSLSDMWKLQMPVSQCVTVTHSIPNK